MCSYEKVFWKTWSKFTGEHPCWNVISIKWQLYWNHTSAWVFSCKFDAYFSEHLFIGTPLENCPCMVLQECFLQILDTFTERNRSLFLATSMKCARFVTFALSVGKYLLFFYIPSFWFCPFCFCFLFQFPKLFSCFFFSMSFHYVDIFLVKVTPTTSAIALKVHIMPLLNNRVTTSTANLISQGKLYYS